MKIHELIKKVNYGKFVREVQVKCGTFMLNA